MIFAYEKQMVKSAEKWLTSQGLATKREFSIPWGICDLVGCSLNDENVKQRIEYGQLNPIGPQIRVMILSEIPDREEGKSITLQKLHAKFDQFLDVDRIAYELNRLVKDKFVQKITDDTFQKRNGWIPLQEKIVALELKLTRLKEALHQASNNREFADESWVGLPMETAQRLVKTKRLSKFASKGIGILGIGMAGCQVFLGPDPTKSHRNQIVQMHCVERFWRTHFKGN